MKFHVDKIVFQNQCQIKCICFKRHILIRLSWGGGKTGQLSLAAEKCTVKQLPSGRWHTRQDSSALQLRNTLWNNYHLAGDIQDRAVQPCSWEIHCETITIWQVTYKTGQFSLAAEKYTETITIWQVTYKTGQLSLAAEKYTVKQLPSGRWHTRQGSSALQLRNTLWNNYHLAGDIQDRAVQPCSREIHCETITIWQVTYKIGQFSLAAEKYTVKQLLSGRWHTRQGSSDLQLRNTLWNNYHLAGDIQDRAVQPCSREIYGETITIWQVTYKTGQFCLAAKKFTVKQLPSGRWHTKQGSSALQPRNTLWNNYHLAGDIQDRAAQPCSWEIHCETITIWQVTYKTGQFSLAAEKYSETITIWQVTYKTGQFSLAAEKYTVKQLPSGRWHMGHGKFSLAAERYTVKQLPSDSGRWHTRQGHSALQLRNTLWNNYHLAGDIQDRAVQPCSWEIHCETNTIWQVTYKTGQFSLAAEKYTVKQLQSCRWHTRQGSSLA